MTSVVDQIVKTLADAGITLLPVDEEISPPEYPSGSIVWNEAYEKHDIAALTGYAPEMYAGVDDEGVCITSITKSEMIGFDVDNPKAFVANVKATMEQFYLAL